MKRSFVYESFRTYDIERFGEPVPVDEEYERTGNLVEIPLGLAWRPLDALAFGVSVNLVRGIVEDRINQEFGGPGANCTSSASIRGAARSPSRLWEAPGPLSLGASVTTAHDLDVERSVELGAVAGDFSDRDRRHARRVPRRLPARARPHWRLGADGTYAAFGEIGPDRSGGSGRRVVVGVGLERRWSGERGARLRRAAAVGRSSGGAGGHAGGLAGRRTRGEPRAPACRSATGWGPSTWLVSYVWIGDEADNGYESQALAAGAFHQRPRAVSILGCPACEPITRREDGIIVRRPTNPADHCCCRCCCWRSR